MACWQGDRLVPRQAESRPAPPLVHHLPCHGPQGTVLDNTSPSAGATLLQKTPETPDSRSSQGWLTWLGRDKGVNYRPKKAALFRTTPHPINIINKQKPWLQIRHTGPDRGTGLCEGKWEQGRGGAKGQLWRDTGRSHQSHPLVDSTCQQSKDRSRTQAWRMGQASTEVCSCAWGLDAAHQPLLP